VPFDYAEIYKLLTYEEQKIRFGGEAGAGGNQEQAAQAEGNKTVDEDIPY
jgi:hypothetical protein